jgi:hypothetical protein
LNDRARVYRHDWWIRRSTLALPIRAKSWSGKVMAGHSHDRQTYGWQAEGGLDAMSKKGGNAASPRVLTAPAS